MKPSLSPAEQHLLVIRSLMERATIYRTISAHTAAFGGSLSIVIAALLVFIQKHSGSLTNFVFLSAWITVLFLTLGFNFITLYWGAKNRGTPFFSPGLKLVVCSLLPYVILSQIVLTIPLLRDLWNRTEAYGITPFWGFVLAQYWAGLYGLALLSTQHFAPRSLNILGWAFFLTPFLVWGISFVPTAALLISGAGVEIPACINMGITFGGYHILYALIVTLRKEDASINLPPLDDEEGCLSAVTPQPSE